MSNQQTVFLVDCGVLLGEKHAEFENYNTVYDRKYGYYDEEQSYMTNKVEAIAYAQQYAKKGVDNTYAVVSQTSLPSDCDPTDTNVTGESYDSEDIVYSIKRVGENLVENFVEGQPASAA